MILSDLDNIAYNKFANGEITLAEYIKYQNRYKIMNYEEKYKAALERAKEMCVMPTDKATMEYIFPELAESADKDERIRRVIIEFLQAQNVLYDKINPEFTMKEAIAWLVKQGQTFTKKDVDDAYLKGVCDTKQELEKQGEQKPTDRTEPKFKVGDWIVGDETPNDVFCVIEVLGEIYKVIDIDGDDYHIPHCKVDKQFHLWTTNDAKDGDVLVSGVDEKPFIFKGLLDSNHPNCPVAYCGIDPEGYFCVSSEKYWWTDDKDDIQPATKERRELLFSKMKEEGYEWDAEKKELKKIEVTSKESEDEGIRKALIEYFGEQYAMSDWNGVYGYQVLAWLEKQGEQQPTDDKKLDVLKFIRKETGCGLAEANNALLKLIKVLKEHPTLIMDKPRKLKIEWEE